MLLDQLYHIKQVYEERLQRLRQEPIPNYREIEFYEENINTYESEIAFQELVEELKLKESAKPEVLSTTCWQTVNEICKNNQVILIRNIWSWAWLCFQWEVHYMRRQNDIHNSGA